ncbi:hypothetical protein HMPREF9574_01761 [Cutibacterium acnes HL074PA1]|nr:hypothetical protein HMPREF9574_01761 [Cutibacterium acnes HL074PA1]EFS40523.1 hypothetical protein HMPREF9575_01788 [Cutibacterium acnes HL110PA1]EFS56991.1 hypothetical protein HMPREF9593_00396 [Cutibacterium acnes HL046PA2]EFT00754.1 hypothetical protein HMPREF9609_00589 [Cutibacterium acnes HL027PA1]
MTTSCAGVCIGLSDADTKGTTVFHPLMRDPGAVRSCHASTLAQTGRSQQMFGKLQRAQ